MTQDLDHPEIREAVTKLCADFPGEYWRGCDRSQAYPTAFVTALTEARLTSPARIMAGNRPKAITELPITT